MKKFIKRMGYAILGDKFNLIIVKSRYFNNKRIFIRKAKTYNSRKRTIVENIAKKDKINILFFILNMAMWKYDGLIKLLINHPKFDVTIIPFIRPQDRKSVSIKNRDDIISYCKNNNLHYIKGYDFENEEYLNIDSSEYDIVVYTQPYDTGYTGWCIDNFIKNSIFIYTPYGLPLGKQLVLHDTYLTNIAWKIFAANDMDQEILKKEITSKTNNVVVTGAAIYDQLQIANVNKSPWKSSDKKRIIWAPHHSIDSKNSFSTSNFERLCWDMINLAKSYRNEIEFIFKPHPLLKERLIKKWGLKETEKYYKLWEEMPNTSIQTGAYTELFAFSNAMIHDSCSFAGEYLFTGNPVMYTVKDNNPPSGINNSFGLACFECHYKGKTIEDIESFIKDVVLENNDRLLLKRQSFIQNQMLPPNGNSTAQNMLKELEELFVL